MELVLGCTTRPYSNITIAEACQHIAASGYSDVALFGRALNAQTSHSDVLALRRLVHDTGLLPSLLLGATHLKLGLEAATEEYLRLIDNTALLGATWLLDTGVSEDALFEGYWSLMQKAAPYADSVGVHLTLKPHGGVTLTSQDLIDAHHRVNHPAFGICYDPGNIIYYSKGEEKPETRLAEVAPLVTTGIIKDCVLRDGIPDVMVTPGEGLVDFQAVLSGLAQGGFRGPLYVECVAGESMAEIDQNVQHTRAFVQEILAGL